MFDNLLAVSGPSVATSIPVLFDMYNWEDQYLDTWAANRGLDAIPGFAYKEVRPRRQSPGCCVVRRGRYRALEF